MLNDQRHWVYYTYVVAAIIMFVAISLRLFHLQIVRGDYYRALASQNHVRVIIKPAPRGRITDRNGLVLADSRPAFIVTAVPSEFDRGNTELMASLLAMTPGALAEILDEASSVPHRPVVIRESMSVEDVSPVAEAIYAVPGVLIDIAPLRRYHRPEDFCHLIGYVGLADAPEYYRGEVVGRAGIERGRNDLIHGTAGLHRQVVDAMGRVVEEFGRTESDEPVPGDEVMLTIDAGLQGVAREMLEETGKAGAIVALNYETGEILCAASSPTFDPNVFARGITTGEWNDLMEDPGKPLFCRAWAAAYPPASAFKIVTAYYLLAEGLVDENTLPAPCYGSLKVGDREFGCWAVHGRLGIVDAVARSCDVFFYRTVQLGTIDGLGEYASAFGLGRKLSDHLIEETSGLVPDTDYFNTRYGPGGWGLGNLLNISIGQGELLATPLQMAVMTGVIASRGGMPMPAVIRGESDRGAVMPSGFADDHAFDVVIESMYQTVVHRRGTLHASFDGFPLEFMGKTGTAECGGEDHAIVVGFISDPEPLALCVIIEHGGRGGSVAGPVARSVLERHYGIEVQN